MTRESEQRAPSVEEAVEAALSELGISEQEALIEVLQEPKGGFLGVGGQEAVVRVRARTPAPDRNDDDREVDPDLEEQADAAADFVEEMLSYMRIDAIAEPGEHGGHMYVDIVDGSEEDMALLIGRQGQTLDAIQELTRMAVGRRLDQRVRVIVDVQDYRKRREERLEAKARDLAEQVRQTGREVEFEPMNSFERKLVHDAVADIPGVESSSRGEEPNRFVVISKR
jgi:spoIIIJ-associated protein